MGHLKIKILAILALLIVIGALVLKNRGRFDQLMPDFLPREKPENLQIDPNILLDDKGTPAKKVTPATKPRPTSLVTAEAYLVGNLETGEIYAESGATRVFPIASISKLFSAMIAIHLMSAEQKITLNEQMLEAYGEAGGLIVNETLSVDELIKPLLIESSNDAAEALAQGYGRALFIESMNSFAKELGMNSTFFQDPSGLSSGNVSNARDLFQLARYLYTNEPNLLAISRTARLNLASSTEHISHLWLSNNPFTGDPNFIGGKTGRTSEAKESMISMFSYHHQGRLYPIVIIVLRSEFSEREIDTSILFEKAMTKIGL